MIYDSPLKKYSLDGTKCSIDVQVRPSEPNYSTKKKMRSLGFVSLARGEGQELFEPHEGNKFAALWEFTDGKVNILHLSIGSHINAFVQYGV